MTKKLSTKERQQQILETLAKMLESGDETKITTANIADRIRVSEATLYRHFTNKEQMFSKLIDFAETNIFSLIRQINQENQCALAQIEQIILLLLRFAERNPGIVHLVLNSQLISKSETLGKQSQQFFKRIESQIKQNIQLMFFDEYQHTNHAVIANVFVAFVMGKWQLYIYSGFRNQPLEHWQEQWKYLQQILTSETT